MAPSQPPKVLILSQNPDALRQWAEMLGSRAEVRQAIGNVPCDAEIDVVVTDLASGEEAGRQTGLEFGRSTALGVGERSAAVIGIGPAVWGDVALGSDFTASELCLACELLGEVARLRRERDDWARRYAEARQLAETDLLTAVANRRAWDRELPQRLALARAEGSRLWLALVDLDRFKQVNEREGYAVGDRVLRQAATALAAELGPHDLLVRWGGDEFGVLLAVGDEAEVGAALERLRAAVSRQKTTNGIALTASIGYVAVDPRDPVAAADWLLAAEGALADAKRGGGDRICRGALNPSASER